MPPRKLQHSSAVKPANTTAVARRMDRDDSHGERKQEEEEVPTEGVRNSQPTCLESEISNAGDSNMSSVSAQGEGGSGEVSSGNRRNVGGHDEIPHSPGEDSGSHHVDRPSVPESNPPAAAAALPPLPATASLPAAAASSVRSSSSRRQDDDDDDMVAQKFQAIPAHHNLGRQQQPADYHQHDRKFPAIPAHNGDPLGLRRSGLDECADGGAVHADMDISNSTSQPGAFAIRTEESSSAAAAAVVHQRRLRMKEATAKIDTGSSVSVAHMDFRRNPQNSEGAAAAEPENLTQDEINSRCHQEEDESDIELLTPINNQSGVGGLHTTAQTETPISNREHSTVNSPRNPAENESTPMIVAELVDPPVEAVQVIYDEGSPQLGMDSTVMPRQEEAAMGGQSKHTRHSKVWAAFCICVLLLVLFVAIPLAVTRDSSGGDDKDSSPVSYPYECFTSTMELLLAQQDQPEQSQFILCPKTRIRIGHVADPWKNETHIVEGDVPLMFVRSNVHVLCGQDGSIDNECVLEGGFAQVFLQKLLPTRNKSELLESTGNDNITVQGLTFTGTLYTDYVLSSSSVVVSDSGNNITLLDCLWENMTVFGGVVFVGNNLFQHYAGLELVEPYSADLRLVESTFRNITYEHAIFVSRNQNLTIQRCQFEDIVLPRIMSPCQDENFEEDYCNGLVYCQNSSYCALEDICVQNLEYAGLASVLVASHNSRISLTGSYNLEGIQSRFDPSDNTCESGFARYWDNAVEEQKIMRIGCLSQEALDVKWTRTEACVLDSLADLHPPMQPVADYDYDCYKSTTEVMLDQYINPEQGLFVMCPNTTIKIGVIANALAGDWSIIDGDIPLAIFRSNLEVRCGLDGAVGNQCLFDGGVIQVLSTPEFPSIFALGIDSNRTDNVTIRGMTFTGQIMPDPTFGGGSIIMSGAGTNIRFVECLWDSILAPQGVVYAGSNSVQFLLNDKLLEPYLVDLAIVNSTFRNVIYNGAILSAWRQNLTVTGTRFENMQLSEFLGNCPSMRNVVGKCQTLVSCADESVCSLENICVESFEYSSVAAIVLASREAQVHLQGSHFVDATSLHYTFTSQEVCSSLLAWVDWSNGERECMTDPSLNLANSCMLK